MLRSNTKAAKANIMQYIKNSVHDYMVEVMEYNKSAGLPEAVYDPENDNDVCAFIFSRFMDETSYDKRRITRQQLFIQWGSGLACGGLFDYYLHAAVETLGNILQETEEEKARFSEAEAEEMLSKLIYREVMAHIPY